MDEKDIEKLLADTDEYLVQSRKKREESQARIAKMEARLAKPTTPAQREWHLSKVRQERENEKRKAKGLPLLEIKMEPYPDEEPEEPAAGGMSEAEIEQLLVDTDAHIASAKETRESVRRLGQELKETPLEEECDAVYAGIGNQLYRQEQTLLRQAHVARGEMKADGLRQREDERLEKSGKPPPLHRVK